MPTRILLTAVGALATWLIFAGFQLTHHRCGLRQVATITACPFRTILACRTIATHGLMTAGVMTLVVTTACLRTLFVATTCRT